jgi:hypothetical protein
VQQEGLGKVFQHLGGRERLKGGKGIIVGITMGLKRRDRNIIVGIIGEIVKGYNGKRI